MEHQQIDFILGVSKMKTPLFYLICTYISSVFLSSCGPGPKADLVLSSGTIYTVNDSIPTVSAIAIAADSIMAIGSATDIAPYIGEETTVINLAGLVAVPGFVETEGDLIGDGYRSLRLDLEAVENFDALIRRVRDRAAGLPPGAWILGDGWNEESWEPPLADPVVGYPRHNDLSQASPDNPVMLRQSGGRASLTNARGLSLSGITGSTFYDGRGTIIKDRSGFPTGVFTDGAQQLVSKRIPRSIPDIEGSTPTVHTVALRAGYETRIRAGFTSIVDTSRVLSRMLSSGEVVLSESDPLNSYLTLRSRASIRTSKDLNVETIVDSQPGPPSAMNSYVRRLASTSLDNSINEVSPNSRIRALRELTGHTVSPRMSERGITGLLPGKRADIVVFSQNFLEIPLEHIENTDVVYSIIGGQIVYRK
jgi:predicted amidohydrolase YtcJ